MDIGHLFDHVDPFAEHFLPVLVLGTKCPERHRAPDERRARIATSPSWLLELDHQFDGYVCAQAHLSGLVMPLRERDDTIQVIADLELLSSEEPGAREQRSLRPDLSRLMTEPGPYGVNECNALGSILASCPSLPRPIGGHEALVELDATDVARTLAGWSVICADPDSIDSPPALHTHTHLDENLVADAEAHFRPEPLRLFLLWVNSD